MADEETPVDEEPSWWRRPAGGREVLAVALPLVVSSLSWTIMTFVDRVMLNHVSPQAMSAAFSAGTVWFAAVCFPLGVCTYASTFVSQYHGAGQPRKIGPITGQAVWVAVAFSPLLLVAAAPFAPQLFALAGHGTEVTGLEIRYFGLLCWGGPALLIAQALSGFYSGRGETRVVMVVDAAFSVLNLVLDYLWIFGKAGFPEMGIDGAAWATVVSLWLKAVCYAWLVLQRRHRKEFATGAGLAFDAALLRRLLWFGGPNGLQMLLDVAGFTVFILLVGRLGDAASAATVMAFSVNSLAFMPVWGIALATSILVGQHLGEDRDDLAARAAWTTLLIGVGYMAVFAVLYAATPNLFLFGFFASAQRNAVDEEVYRLAVVLLRFVAAYTLFDAVLMIFSGAIKGAGDTRFVLHVSLVMAVVLAAASWLAVEVGGVGVYGCWTLVTIWICVLGVIFLARFLQGKWRSMRVIEEVGSRQQAEGSDAQAT